jgi:thymidylate synthase
MSIDNSGSDDTTFSAFHTEETQYLDLIREILDKGNYTQSRNGNTYSVFGRSMHFSLSDGQLPIITTKKVAWKTCAKELFWFLSGNTDNSVLQKQGVRIWNENSTREYLDKRGLSEYEENELGPIYGYQWRHFGLPYTKQKDRGDSYTDMGGVDQIAEIIRMLRDPVERNSRRIILSAWNPLQLPEMALPPCHILAQFNVRNGQYLSCAMYQRSGDVGLGVPFNITSYCLLTHILAKHTGLIAEEFVYFLGNAHVYEEHISALREQLQNKPLQFPKIHISGDDTTHTKIEDYSLDDIQFVSPYLCHSVIKMEMKA